MVIASVRPPYVLTVPLVCAEFLDGFPIRRRPLRDPRTVGECASLPTATFGPPRETDLPCTRRMTRLCPPTPPRLGAARSSASWRSGRPRSYGELRSMRPSLSWLGPSCPCCRGACAAPCLLPIPAGG